MNNIEDKLNALKKEIENAADFIVDSAQAIAEDGNTKKAEITEADLWNDCGFSIMEAMYELRNALLFESINKQPEVLSAVIDTDHEDGTRYIVTLKG